MTRTFLQFSARLGEFIRQPGGLPHDTLPADLEGEFDQLAIALFTFQFEHNPAYRNLCEARRQSPATVRRWSEIPAVPAAAFKELELTSLPPAERTTVFHSSGTTEQRPSRHFHDRDSLAIYEASLLPWFQGHLLPERDGATAGYRPEFQFISLTPPASVAPHSSLVHMFECAMRTFGSTDSFCAGDVDTEGVWTPGSQRLLDALREATRPVMLLGTAFNFVQLADALATCSRWFELPAGSRVLETGGYKGRSRALSKAALHKLISASLGVAPDHIVCEYGMSELSSQAYDCTAGIIPSSHPVTRCFCFPPWVRVQIISPETGGEVAEGGTGLLRVFDLANVRSVLAVQTEDLATRRAGGFELLGRAALAEPRGCSLMTA